MNTIPARKRDELIIKIVDWADDSPSGEPAIDLEVYLSGTFDMEKSRVFPIKKGRHDGDSRETALLKASLSAIKVLNEFQERSRK